MSANEKADLQNRNARGCNVPEADSVGKLPRHPSQGPWKINSPAIGLFLLRLEYPN